jgi:RNA polymerase sigma-70 factor (ECF subfamily)
MLRCAAVPGREYAVRAAPRAVKLDASRDGSAASRRLYEHGQRLYRAAYALCGSRADAEDLVQETFARVLGSRRGVRHRDSLPYLMRALRNTWIDFQRARAVRPVAGGAEGVEWVVDGSADPQIALDMQAAYAAMLGLSQPLREAIAAVDVLGLSYKEAAKALRIRQGTLMSRLSRARDRVAGELEGS